MQPTRRSVMSALGATLLIPKVGAATTGGLIDDLPLLKRAYGLLHPGLYRYQTPDEWSARLEQVAREQRETPNLHRDYANLSRVTAGIRCAHSYANFFNQSKSVASKLFAPANKLPFHFIWVGDRMVVTANPEMAGGLSRGTEILTVDGVAVAEIQSRLMPYLRADGGNDAKRRRLLDVEAKNGIETFDVLYPLLFPVKRTFDLSVRPPADDAVRRVAVAAIDLSARRAQAGTGFDPSTPEYWQLDFPALRVARITMPGWALYNQSWDWQARIDGFFEEIARKQATALIIDIRDNEGGLDCGNAIIAHLIDRDLPLSDLYERCVRFRSTPEDLRPYLDTWDRSFDTLGEGATDLANGFYRLAPPEGESVITPKPGRFQGKVIVLSSPENSSATFQFISLVKRYRLGRIYGQPTGGNQRGINGGAFFFLRLPNSGLEVDLPLIGFFPKTPQPDAGILPDLEVAVRVEDIGKNVDSVLDRAIADLM